MVRRHLARVAAAVAAALTLAGCASMPGASGAGGLPTDGDTPVVQVDVVGGFIPEGSHFAATPQLVVYADGTVITHGPVSAIYPGPKLPNLVSTDVERARIVKLLERAARSGLLRDGVEYGQPGVADAPTTRVTVRTRAGVFTHEAAALGIHGSDAGVDERATQARQLLWQFVEEARELDPMFDGAQVSMTRFALRARLATDTGPDPSGIDRAVVAWVAGVPLAGASDCVSVDGAVGEQVGQVLAKANQLTLFDDGGVVYEVFARPLLRHEAGCDDLP